MERPTAEIEECRAAHARLADVLEGLTDATARKASILPDWTVGHVLSHLARNAEAMARRIEAAMRGELIDHYPGGAEGRAAQIEAGAGRPAEELVADVLDQSERLDAMFASLPGWCWSRPVRSGSSDVHPVAELPFRRWREVEVHLVDLGIGIGPPTWSQGLVDRQLPRLLAGLADRADHRSLMAWMLGRGAPPELGPWA